jgi:cholesterol oxidase
MKKDLSDFDYVVVGSGFGGSVSALRSPDRGVTGFNGEVFGYPNLFIADGSVVPANLGVNPALTITALSEYIMSQRPEK